MSTWLAAALKQYSAHRPTVTRQSEASLENSGRHAAAVVAAAAAAAAVSDDRRLPLTHHLYIFSSARRPTGARHFGTAPVEIVGRSAAAGQALTHAPGGRRLAGRGDGYIDVRLSVGGQE